jgi:predicted component of type VI protein secretion system
LHAGRQEAEAATAIIRHLSTFEPRVARQLVRETGLSLDPQAAV